MKRFFVMLLACLMLLSVVPFSVFAEEVDHEHVEGTEQCPGKDVDHTLENAASVTKLEEVRVCKGYNYNVYKCNVCGEIFADDFVKVEGNHVFGEVAVEEAVAPTCTTTGKTAVYKCINCDATEGGEIIPARHNIVDGACTECDYVVDPECTHSTEKLTNATVIVAPTCGEAGKMQYICECGEIVDIVIKALGHSNLEHTDEVEADCTTAGKKAYDTCKDCGKIFINGEEVTEEDLVIEALGHDMGEAVVTKQATCDEKGLEVATCTRCDYTVETETDYAHEWLTEEGNDVAANCTRPGISYQVCNLCGETRNLTSTPAIGHQKPENWTHGFTAEEIANAPCDVELSTTYKCVACGSDIKVIVKAASAHTFTEEIEEATCSTVEKIWNVCACGAKELVSEGTEFNPENHNFEWKWINEATCLKDGNKILFCYGCKTESGDPVFVPAGHTWFVVNTVDSTCTSFGYTDYECENCDEFDRVFGEILSHNYDEGVYHSATCKNDAYTTYECKAEGCVYVKVEIHEGTQLEFDWTKKFETLKEAQEAHENAAFEEFEVISGSCTEKGIIIYMCTLCEKNVLVVEAGTGEGHVRPEGPFDCTEAFNCAECGELVEGGEHTSNYVVKEPTCNAKGKSYCYDCGNFYDTFKHEDILLEIVEGKDATCTETGLSIGVKCGVCGEMIDEQVVLPVIAHTYVKNDAFSFVADCEIDGYNFMECACGDRFITDYEAASGHWYIDEENDIKVELNTPDCDAVCVCGQEVCVCRVCSLCGETIEKHTFAEPNVVDPTCTEEGYTITVCTSCGYYIIDEDSIVDPNGHNMVPADTSTLPTYRPGYINEVCSVCGELGESKEVAGADLGLTIEIDNAIVAGANFSDSSRVSVIIDINSVKDGGAAVWGIDFLLNYNSDKFIYVDTYFVGEDFNGYCVAVDNNGCVKIVATTANNEYKDSLDTVIDSEGRDFVIVEFIVNDRIEDGKNPATGNAYSDVIANPFFITEANAINKDKEEVSVWGQVETEITIDKFLDFNNDGTVNYVDYNYAWDIICGVITDISYDARIDVDKDGLITMVDFEAIVNFYAGMNGFDYEALWNLNA